MKRNGDTKSAMAAALREAMRERSIDRISIKTITDACGLNRQTFYYHFRDIYDLVKWMYVHEIQEAMEASYDETSWEATLRNVLLAFDKEREAHLAIYNSRNYYPTLRSEIMDSLTERFQSVFDEYFDELGFNVEYREFLRRMYALVIFEFIERRARGNAFSSLDGFVDNWFRTIHMQFEGERQSRKDT